MVNFKVVQTDNSEVSAFGGILMCCINSTSIRTASASSEVAAIGMYPLSC